MAKVERNIKVGQSFEKEHNGKAYTLKVVAHEDGMAFKVSGPKGFKNSTNPDREISPLTFRSVSSAASSVMGPGNVNGWKFWGIDPDEAPAPKAKAKTSGEGKAAAPKAKGSAKAEPKAVQGSKASRKAGPVTTKVAAKGKAKSKPVAVLEDEEDDEDEEEMDFEEDEDEDDDED